LFDKNLLKILGYILHYVTNVILLIGVFYGIGYFIDVKILNSKSYILTIIFTFLGLIIGFYYLVRSIKNDIK
jgi:F0F1-type ATP synthase assembly protein I